MQYEFFFSLTNYQFQYFGPYQQDFLGSSHFVLPRLSHHTHTHTHTHTPPPSLSLANTLLQFVSTGGLLTCPQMPVTQSIVYLTQIYTICM